MRRFWQWSSTTRSVCAALALTTVVVGCGSGGETAGSRPEASPTPPGFLFAESFDGGSVGEDITPANTAFNVVENQPATFEASPPPVDGSLVGHYPSVGDNIRTKVEFAVEGDDPAGAATLYERVYLWVDAYPGAVMRFLTLETSPEVTPPGEDVLALRMDARGHIEVYDGAEFEPENETVTEIPRGAWVRVEVMFDADAGPYGQTELRLFTGSNVDGIEPDETLTIDHVGSPSNPVTTAAFGVLNLVDVDFSLDAIEASTADWPGPVEVG
jgi:hypothetical protein